MTDTTWHLPPSLLERYADDPATVDDVAAASVEAHLIACPDCRQILSRGADPARIRMSWDAVADRIDQPRAAAAERLLVRVGMDAGVGRLVAATPALRGAGFAAVVIVAAGAALVSRSADAVGPFLVLAPLVPLVAVAASFSPTADPAGEAGVATALHGAGLVVRRALAVVTITVVLLGLAALALPSLGSAAAAWLLPALALALGTLALGTWLRVEAAVGLLAGLWLLGVWSAWWLDGRDEPLVDSAAFAAGGQLTALAAAAAAAAVLTARRDHFATLEGS